MRKDKIQKELWGETVFEARDNFRIDYKNQRGRDYYNVFLYSGIKQIYIKESTAVTKFSDKQETEQTRENKKRIKKLGLCGTKANRGNECMIRDQDS